MEMERQINAISYFYSKTQQEILEEAFQSYWKECFRKNGNALKILMKLNEKNIKEKNQDSRNNTDINETKTISKKLGKEIIQQLKQISGINNRFENSKIDNIYQIPNDNKEQ